VVKNEPSPLTEVRSLPTGLKVKPGLREELVRRGSVFERGGSVVGFEQVFDDGAGLEESDGGVGVFDGGDAAVGVNGLEGLWIGVLGDAVLGCGGLVVGFGGVLEGLRTLVEDAEVHEFGLVGDVELI
jgi:hypothetical protein